MGLNKRKLKVFAKDLDDSFWKLNKKQNTKPKNKVRKGRVWEEKCKKVKEGLKVATHEGAGAGYAFIHQGGGGGVRFEVV